MRTPILFLLALLSINIFADSKISLKNPASQIAGLVLQPPQAQLKSWFKNESAAIRSVDTSLIAVYMCKSPHTRSALHRCLRTGFRSSQK